MKFLTPSQVAVAEMIPASGCYLWCPTVKEYGPKILHMLIP